MPARAQSATDQSGTFFRILKKIAYSAISKITGAIAYKSVRQSGENTTLATTKHGETASTFCLAKTSAQQRARDNAKPKDGTLANKNIARPSNAKATAVFALIFKSKEGNTFLLTVKEWFFIRPFYITQSEKIFRPKA